MDKIEVPQSYEAECYLLGAILQDNKSYFEIAKEISRDDFFDAGNQLVYGALEDLMQSSDKVDEFSLANYMKDNNCLERVGGVAFISSLMDYVDSLEVINNRIEIVRTKSMRRQLISFSDTIKDHAFDESVEVSSTIASIQNKILDMSSRKKVSDLVHIKYSIEEVYQKIHQLSKNEIKSTGVATGYVAIDQKTQGLHPQTLNIIGARPSMGKTAFGLNIAEFAAVREKIPVAFFSLEMSTEEVILRLLASQSEIELSWLKAGILTKDDWKRLGKAVLDLSGADVYIDDSPVLTPMDVYSKLYKLINMPSAGGQRNDVKLVFIDYLQLMSGDKGKRFESKNIEITEISRTLKAISKEFDVAVVALSQLSRASEKRKGKDIKPKLSDLRESGAIEQDADLVMFIHRPEYYDRDNEDLKRKAEIIIAKQRNGPLGVVELVFQDKFTKFTNPVSNEEYNEQDWHIKSPEKDKKKQGKDAGEALSKD